MVHFLVLAPIPGCTVSRIHNLRFGLLRRGPGVHSTVFPNVVYSSMCSLLPHSLVVDGQSAKKKKKKKKKMCKTSYVKKWEVFYCMPMEVKEDAQEQSVTVAGLPGWHFLCQLSQIWHILKWLAVKKSLGISA